MNGFYNIVKPVGISSSHLVVRLKKVLREKCGAKIKVGHLGTLDPMASGVLGVAVGSATRLFDYFLAKKKVYVATCVLGKETDTLDSAGKVIAEKEYLGVSDDAFLQVLQTFRGKISQVPPSYSAKSIGGVRSYRLAAKGINPDLKPCEITIYDILYLGKTGENIFKIQVSCSGGTYIRSLCRDIGKALGYPAYMGSLDRIENGSMALRDAVSIEKIEEDLTQGFTSLEDFGKKLEKMDFSEDFKKKLDNGVKLTVSTSSEYLSVYLSGEFYGIGKVADGLLSVIARENGNL